jgi:nucleoside-diphosphate-sugar epimerase
MNKVLLTGATGFLGSYMLRLLLKKGYQVRAIRRKESPMALLQDISTEVEWVEGDVTDIDFLEEAVQGIDFVYHAAAAVSFNSKDKEKMMSVNGNGTENIVNACLDNGVKKLLHVSSIAALGRKENVTIIDENAQWENSPLNSDYAISKFKAECEVWRGIQEGLNAVIVNPTLIMGAGYWHQGTCKMFKQADKGLMFYPKGGNGFVDVRDVAELAVKLMESEISGDRFIVNAENHLFKDAFTMMAKSLEKKAPFIKAPDWSIELMWRADSLKSTLMGVEPLITKELARGLQTFFQYDNSKLLQKIDHKYRSLQTIIDETAALYLENKKNNQAYGLLDF